MEQKIVGYGIFMFYAIGILFGGFSWYGVPEEVASKITQSSAVLLLIFSVWASIILLRKRTSIEIKILGIALPIIILSSTLIAILSNRITHPVFEGIMNVIGVFFFILTILAAIILLKSKNNSSPK